MDQHALDKARLRPGDKAVISWLAAAREDRPKLYDDPYDLRPLLYFNSGSQNAVTVTIISSEDVRGRQWLFVLLDREIRIGWIPRGFLKRML